MIRNVIILIILGLALLATSAQAEPVFDPGDHVENRYDRRGDHIDRNMDRQAHVYVPA